MFTFRVDPDDGEPYEVAAKSRHIVEWEERFKRSLRAVQESMSMTALTELAYVTAMRHGQYDGPYQEFKKTVDIEAVPRDEDEDTDPTQPDR